MNRLPTRHVRRSKAAQANARHFICVVSYLSMPLLRKRRQSPMGFIVLYCCFWSTVHPASPPKASISGLKCLFLLGSARPGSCISGVLSVFNVANSGSSSGINPTSWSFWSYLFRGTTIPTNRGRNCWNTLHSSRKIPGSARDVEGWSFQLTFVVWRNFQTFWANEVSKIINGFCEEATFPEFDGSICAVKKREYVANVYDMFIWEFRKHDDIVEVDKCKPPLDSWKGSVLCALKSVRGAAAFEHINIFRDEIRQQSYCDQLRRSLFSSTHYSHPALRKLQSLQGRWFIRLYRVFSIILVWSQRQIYHSGHRIKEHHPS